MKIQNNLVPADLSASIKSLFELAADKTLRLSRRWEIAQGAPVITVEGKYVGRNWTQWTQGFAYGNAILCYDLTGQAGC